jgi:hypothetical protein
MSHSVASQLLRLEAAGFNATHCGAEFGLIGGIMKGTKLAGTLSRTELIDVAGTIVIMLLSTVCVVLVCAAANNATRPAAKIIYAAPAASAPNGVASIEPR